MGAAIAAPLVVGAVGQVAEAVGGALGGKQQAAERISPYATEALRTGVETAKKDLAAMPVVSTQDVLDAYRQSQARLGAMEAPAPTIGDVGKTIEEISGAAVKAAAPVSAARERAYRETAGVYGPTAMGSQARAGEVAQEKNMIAEMVANLKKELETEKYNQTIQSFREAFGLERGRQQVASEPFQLINTLRQGLTGQLLGAGSPASSVRMQSAVPAWSSALGSVGTGVANAYLQNELINQLRDKKTVPPLPEKTDTTEE